MHREPQGVRRAEDRDGFAREVLEAVGERYGSEPGAVPVYPADAFPHGVRHEPVRHPQRRADPHLAVGWVHLEVHVLNALPDDLDRDAVDLEAGCASGMAEAHPEKITAILGGR